MNHNFHKDGSISYDSYSMSHTVWKTDEVWLILHRFFMWVWQPVDASCVIWMLFYSELINHVSEDWQVLVRLCRTHTKCRKHGKYHKIWAIFVELCFLDFYSNHFILLSARCDVSSARSPAVRYYQSFITKPQMVFTVVLSKSLEF